MARHDINRSGEIEVFVRVVERGTLLGRGARARHDALGGEQADRRGWRTRLGARLINRTTRKLQLTPEGAAFYESGMRILADIERGRARGCGGRRAARPAAGQLQRAVRPALSAAAAAGIPGTLIRRSPSTSSLTDQVVDLLEERADVAIRAGPLRDSQARRAQALAEPHGGRGSPGLSGRARHAAVAGRSRRPQSAWTSASPGRSTAGRSSTATGDVAVVPTSGNALVSDGEAMRLMALAGVGLGRLSRYHVSADIDAGALVPRAGGLQSRRRGAAPRRLCRPGRAPAGARARLPRFPGRECPAAVT